MTKQALLKIIEDLNHIRSQLEDSIDTINDITLELEAEKDENDLEADS
jgi:hypothetical protein